MVASAILLRVGPKICLVVGSLTYGGFVAANIPFTTFDRESATTKPTAHVGGDSYDQGKTTAEAFVALLKDGALELALAPREFLAATTSEAKAFLAGLEDNWKQDNGRQDEQRPGL